MSVINRNEFLKKISLLGNSLILFGGFNFPFLDQEFQKASALSIKKPQKGEDIFSYIKRVNGKMDLSFYRQILGASNEFKEGDNNLGLAAKTQKSRENARALLGNTKIRDLNKHKIYVDAIYELIQTSINLNENQGLQEWTINELKNFVLTASEDEIKSIMPLLTSDVIACLVKVMNNEELVHIGQTVFNPLPNSKIGSKGYLSARVQPNSPTDNKEDIVWQVFDAWSFAVGDLVLGTNPVSSEAASVAKIEKALYDIIATFNLQKVIPNCVLSHIDIQAEVEEMQPGTTGIWFQSLAGTVSANKTFGISIEKMFDYASKRKGQYGFYIETGQGADFTNGHGKGFDMVIHESRKYGFLRALKAEIYHSNSTSNNAWVFHNDVAGFIGPEVFRTKEQLVRCCLEDTVMGKLHGLTIGLDICSTLHMDISLEDLDWCIKQVMPANPAYLMALPTKNDPMLSYLTTAFSDHIKIRKEFGYKVNDTMWDFFKKLEVIDENNQPTVHFGDPIWVYYKYCLAKADSRSKEEIYQEGKKHLADIRKRGVPIAEGYGKNYWDLEPELEQKVSILYEDAKVSLWTKLTKDFISSIPASVSITTKSKDRKGYLYHPEAGEKLNEGAIKHLKKLKDSWEREVPDVQIIISDGLNARALMDEGHLTPFLDALTKALQEKGYKVGKENIVITNGRVRAGYFCGEILYAQEGNITECKGVIHIIGERPGSGHHNFSAYLTAAPIRTWNKNGSVDHNISRVVSGISDTALKPEQAVIHTMRIWNQLFPLQG